MNKSTFFSQFLSMMIQGVKTCYDTLDSIDLGGFTPLDILVTVAILSVVIPILISTASVKVETSTKKPYKDKTDRK